MLLTQNLRREGARAGGGRELMSSKSKIARISLILALALTLSACNFFDGMTKITSVNVEATSGLADSNGDGIYEIYSGESFTLTVSWNNKLLINNPTIKWFALQNGGEKQEVSGQTAATLTTSLSGSVGATIEYSASANSVQSSNSIKIVIVARPSGGGGQGGGEGGEGGGGEGGDPPAPSISFTVETSGTSAADSDGYVGAKYGKQFAVSVNLGGQTIISPVYEWYVKEDGVQRQLEGAGDSINFTISSRSIARYEFWAVLKLDEDIPSTNTAKVKFVESTLIVSSIDCTSHTIAQGMVQQNINDGLENVVLTAVWNEDEIPEDLVTFTWSVDDVQQDGQTSKTFTYNVGSISSACEKTIKVSGSFAGQVTMSVSIKLSFVEKFVAVSNVTLAVTQDANVGKAYELPYTYKIKNATLSEPGSVTVTANVTNEGTDLSTPCTWTIRDLSGTRTVAGTGRTNTIALSYGKNVITATIDNIESRSVTVYALTSSELSDRRGVIQDTFVWDGSVQDHYINNQEELNMFIGYLVSTHKTAPDAGSSSPNVHTYYLAPPEWRDGVNTTAAFATARSLALSKGVDESGGASISTLGNEKICLTDDSTLGEPEGALATDYVVSQENVYVRYKEVSFEESRSKLPVDDFDETMDVENSNQLMRAVMWGYKPNIVGENAVALGQLYSKARSMLMKYVGKNMTELQKVAVIYDWLVNEVDYDYKAAYESTDINVYAYYLEGVFNFVSIDSKSGWNARAVCDGKSKAFALLCGMEGIRVERIIGTAGDEGDEEHWSGHAWNKVLVDVDGDGIREWFAIDSTWGDVAINTDDTGKHKKEYLSYEYYLVSDDFIDDTHASDMVQPLATTEIDIYDLIEINGTTLDITTQDQLLKLYLYSGGHDSIKIRCRIADSVMVNAGTRSSLINDEEDVYYYSAA